MQKETKEAVAVYLSGEGLSNEQLLLVLGFYRRLRDDLDLLGPHFFLATAEIHKHITGLERFAFYRGLK